MKKLLQFIVDNFFATICSFVSLFSGIISIATNINKAKNKKIILYVSVFVFSSSFLYLIVQYNLESTITSQNLETSVSFGNETVQDFYFEETTACKSTQKETLDKNKSEALEEDEKTSITKKPIIETSSTYIPICTTMADSDNDLSQSTTKNDKNNSTNEEDDTTTKRTETQPKITVSHILLSEEEITLEQHDSALIFATVIYTNSSTDNKVSWVSSDERVAIVTNGKVYALSVGQATISATRDGVTKSCKLIVKNKKTNGIILSNTSETILRPISKISINKSNLSLTVGETSTLNSVLEHSNASIIFEATVIPENATDTSVSVISNNTSVATVSTKRNKNTTTITVIGKSEGEAIITIISNGNKDLSKKYYITVIDANVLWDSSNNQVATVNNGKISAKAEGDAVVTVKYKNISSSCKVSVSEQTKVLSIMKDDGISSVSGSGAYKVGSKVTVKAIGKNGYGFKNWTSNLNNLKLKLEEHDEYSFIMPNSDVVLTANSIPTIIIDTVKKTNTTANYNYNIKNGDNVEIKFKIVLPTEYIQNSHKYTLWGGVLKNGVWIETGNYYLDGGTISYVYTLKTSELNLSNGKYYSAFGVFESENFISGKSLSDAWGYINLIS